MMRSHTCGELTKEHIGMQVVLCGWVQSRRDHGGIIFVDLRDRYGLTQVVFDPSHDKRVHEIAEHISREYVLSVKGKVRHRKPGMVNEKLYTGEIEIITDELEIINKTLDIPPIEVDDKKIANDEIRLTYRYLDLRRPQMQRNLLMRHVVVTAAREHFNQHGFLEIETPLLVKSTPEGARDYVVPSRINPGKFYALPQSPQLYKQILMIAGCDRYYQVARCLRDEDLRADRQPEHTQFDFEMSFVTSEYIRAFVEGLYKHVFKKVLDVELEEFPVITYADAMAKFGSDKPDIRFKLELQEVTEICHKSDFSVFKNAASVKCLAPHKDFTRKEFDELGESCVNLGAKGMAWAKVTEKGLDSSIVKYIPEPVQQELIKETHAKPGSSLLFIADEEKKVNKILGQLRLRLGEQLGLINKNEFKFCFVTDFPLFAWNEDEERWEPEHHMFSMPKKEYITDFEKRPGDVIGDLWDVCLNGLELGSGSMRVSDPALQERIMNFIGITKEQAKEKFGFLLEAYKYGAPVHGGMGLGVDRLVALMLGTNDIREVIAFPKNKNAECPMDDSPSDISEKQLRELHIQVKK
ncbi:MAG: aspartate--tRNA ligase [Nanoarchaeota archaeon]